MRCVNGQEELAHLARQKIEVEEAALLAKKTATEAELKSLEKQKQVAEEAAKEIRQRANADVELLQGKKAALENESAVILAKQQAASEAAAAVESALEEKKALLHFLAPSAPSPSATMRSRDRRSAH
jgi:chromosome segregation ATPase